MTREEKNNEIDTSSMNAVRALNFTAKSSPRRAVSLGFVDLKAKGHTRPRQDEEYDVIPASSEALAQIEFPDSRFKRLDLDLFEFYSADLPDLWGANEGLVKVSVDTRDPQNIDAESATAKFATDFIVRDGAYAPSFLYRGVFRNILFEDWVNLSFDLYELDTDATVYYEKIKGVINGVPEIKNLDVLKGIPYLNLAANLFDGIIRTFGRNPDDHLWGEFPILDLEPLVGGAFLRSGIYVLFERTVKGDEVDIKDLSYENGRLQSNSRLSNHLIFGTRIRDFATST